MWTSLWICLFGLGEGYLLRSWRCFYEWYLIKWINITTSLSVTVTLFPAIIHLWSWCKCHIVWICKHHIRLHMFCCLVILGTGTSWILCLINEISIRMKNELCWSLEYDIDLSDFSCEKVGCILMDGSKRNLEGN